MSKRVPVWGLFLGSALCLGIQIAQEWPLPPGESADEFWGALAVNGAVLALYLLAHEK
jgi:hypothetical protein